MARTKTVPKQKKSANTRQTGQIGREKKLKALQEIKYLQATHHTLIPKVA